MSLYHYNTVIKLSYILLSVREKSRDLRWESVNEDNQCGTRCLLMSLETDRPSAVLVDINRHGHLY